MTKGWRKSPRHENGAVATHLPTSGHVYDRGTRAAEFEKRKLCAGLLAATRITSKHVRFMAVISGQRFLARSSLHGFGRAGL